jgi:hypothetical protein
VCWHDLSIRYDILLAPFLPDPLHTCFGVISQLHFGIEVGGRAAFGIVETCPGRA